MNRRVHDRLTIKLEARVCDLNCEGASEVGELLDASESGVCVILTVPLVPGDLVRIEFSEGTIFGQVAHVTAEDETYRTGVEVFEVLLGCSDLSRLIQKTLGLPGPARAARHRTGPHAL